MLYNQFGKTMANSSSLQKKIAKLKGHCTLRESEKQKLFLEQLQELLLKISLYSSKLAKSTSPK